MGYHIANIPCGIYGDISKIEEELSELKDAINQGNRIMQLIELSDLLGAISGYLEKNHPSYSINDIIIMSQATDRAFKDGTRQPKR